MADDALQELLHHSFKPHLTGPEAQASHANHFLTLGVSKWRFNIQEIFHQQRSFHCCEF